MPENTTWDRVKTTTVPIGVVVTGLLFAQPVFNWFHAYHAPFITHAEASAQIETKLAQVEHKVEENTAATQALKNELRMRSALQRVEALEARLYVLNRDQADPDLVHEIEISLGRANQYLDCLIGGLSHCERLEPGRTR